MSLLSPAVERNKWDFPCSTVIGFLWQVVFLSLDGSYPPPPHTHSPQAWALSGQDVCGLSWANICARQSLVRQWEPRVENTPLSFLISRWLGRQVWPRAENVNCYLHRACFPTWVCPECEFTGKTSAIWKFYRVARHTLWPPPTRTLFHFTYFSTIPPTLHTRGVIKIRAVS